MLKSQNLKQKPFWQIFNSWESSPSPLGPQKIFTRVHLATNIILLCFIAPITQPALPDHIPHIDNTDLSQQKYLLHARKNICLGVLCWRHGGLPSTAGQHAAVCGAGVCGPARTGPPLMCRDHGDQVWAHLHPGQWSSQRSFAEFSQCPEKAPSSSSCWKHLY